MKGVSANISTPRIGVLSSHPIQYQAPWLRALAKVSDLEVFFGHRPTSEEQGEGFGKPFEWDVDLLSGYHHQFLKNRAKRPSVSRYSGCDTPEIGDRIRRGGFDAFIVTGWYLKCYWQAIHACRRAGVPVLVRGDSQLVTPRSKVKKILKEVVYRRMLRSFDGFLTVGERNAAYLRHYGVQENKLFSAPHFIDNTWFCTTAAKDASAARILRSEWHVGETDFVVAFFGKLIAKKRPGDLLEAVSQLSSNTGLKLVYVGSGILERSLRDRATEVGVEPIFAGFKNQSELPAHYAAVDLVVLPSDGGETWGLVVNEAMACGTPAVVSDACGCAPDLIEPGVTGFIFPTGDVAALAKAIAKVASMYEAGYPWHRALVPKMQAYSVEACTAGTVTAVRTLISRRSSQ